MGLMTPPQNNLLLRNTDGGQDPDKVVAPVKKKIIYMYTYNKEFQFTVKSSAVVVVTNRSRR
jgi:hypothetical protein